MVRNTDPTTRRSRWGTPQVADLVREQGADPRYFEHEPWPTDGTKPTWYWRGPGGREMNFRIGDKALYDLITGQQGDANAVAQFFRWMGKLGFNTPWGRFEPLKLSAE